MVFASRFLTVAACVVASVTALPIMPRTLMQIQNDLSTISSKITAISSASIFAQGNTTPVLSLAVVNAITALDTAAKTAVSDTLATGNLTDAQCAQLLQATTPLIPNTLSLDLPQLVKAKPSLVANFQTGAAVTALTNSKTDLHNFIGDLSARCPVARQASWATIQSQTDSLIQGAITQLL